MSYLDSFKMKYPTMSYKFYEEQVARYMLETKDLKDQSPELKRKSDMMIIINEWLQTGKMNVRNFYILRKCIATWREEKRIEYLTSPESETYWCS